MANPLDFKRNACMSEVVDIYLNEILEMFLKMKQLCHLVSKVNAALILFLRKFSFSFLCTLSNYFLTNPQYLDNSQAERLRVVPSPLKSEVWYKLVWILPERPMGKTFAICFGF